MKLPLGLMIIAACHYGLGVIYNSSPFTEPGFPYMAVYALLIGLSIPNGVFAVRSRNKSTFMKWVASSTLPGLLFMTYAKTQNNSGGLMPTTWDWGLWELFLPAIFGIVQIVILIYFLGTRARRAKGRAHQR
ncbi:hypothetical protein ACFQMJ_32395 [Cohnella cellulosilytica]|uniref:Uncharacterized protein n=1 Tax=Cohnella cellulosilytica TaxID=986710 RepID=A0ABW2FJB1_9BACL